MNELKPNEVRSEQSGLLSLPFLAFFCSPLMEDHLVKRRRIEEPAEAAQATVVQTQVGNRRVTDDFVSAALSAALWGAYPKSTQTL